MSIVYTSSAIAKASVAVASSLSQAGYALQPGPSNSADLAIRTPQQAMQRVRSQYQAKVLTIQASQVNGNPGYRVKLLTAQGEVFYVLVDAKTGAIYRN
ncbi:PepSY domain-containing protein [Shewanella sp. SR44-3]|nr:PepSY domain-containing protein [Shewanella sp. SR44-3]